MSVLPLVEIGFEEIHAFGIGERIEGSALAFDVSEGCRREFLNCFRFRELGVRGAVFGETEGSGPACGFGFDVSFAVDLAEVDSHKLLDFFLEFNLSDSWLVGDCGGD